jgi:hypothetical protein
VKNMLLVQRQAVDSVFDKSGTNLLALANGIQRIGAPVVGVAAFCLPPSGKRLGALATLENLGSICSQVMPGRMENVFYSLLKVTAEAYLR